MSWSISFIGKPEKVAEAIEENGGKLDGQSRIEFDSAKPHLIALVKDQNFAIDGYGYIRPMIRIEASGSGSARGDKQVQRSLLLKIEPIYTVLV